jgi:hypothetical protein
VEGEQAHVRAELLVEELLQRECALALVAVLRVQRLLGMATLELGDDGRRVGDGPAVEHEQRERVRAALGQPQRDRDVRGRWWRAPLVVDPLCSSAQRTFSL